MKNHALAAGWLIILAVLLGAVTPETQSSFSGTASELWQKAVAVFAKNNDLFPGQVRTSVAMLDGKGRPKKTFERELRYFLDSQGKISAELVWAKDNEQDVTAKVKAEIHEEERMARSGEESENSMTFSLRDVPFDPEKQDQVEVEAHPDAASLFGYSCRRFDFALRISGKTAGRRKGKPVTMKGMAWIDEASGAPVKFEFAPDPLPSKVKSLWTVFTYGPGPNGEWLLKEIASEGVGGILFIKKRFRSRVELDDYFPTPRAEEGSAPTNPDLEQNIPRN